MESKPKLSICLPTYNRSYCLNRTLRHLIKYPGNEIEIVLSNNGSTDDTREIVQKIKDPRIKYFENKRNLGFDINVMLVCERASADFLFFISDEDYLNLDIIPQIEEIIAKNADLSLLLGAVGDTRPGEMPIYYPLPDKKYTDRNQAIGELFFSHTYMCGIVLKKSSLNFKTARNYIGSLYMHLILMAQALTQGATITSSQIFVSIGPKGEELGERLDKDPVVKGIPYFMPISRLKQMHFRILFLRQLKEQFPDAGLKLLKNDSYAIAKFITTLAFQRKYSWYESLYYYFQSLKYMLQFREVAGTLHFWISLTFLTALTIKKRLMKN